MATPRFTSTSNAVTNPPCITATPAQIRRARSNLTLAKIDFDRKLEISRLLSGDVDAITQERCAIIEEFRLSEEELEKARAFYTERRHDLAVAEDSGPIIEILQNEPKENGTVLALSLSLAGRSGGQQVYSYAIRRVGVKWFTTGATCPTNGYTWKGLLAFLETGRIVSLTNMGVAG